MSTEIMHGPTPEFRDYLEGEVALAFRRRRTFGRLRVLALVIVSLAVGTSAGLAGAQIAESAQRDSLLEVARSEMMLAALRLELARARMGEVAAKIKAGALGEASLAAAESELRAMEAEAMRVRLNIEEIQKTGQPVRNELNAPLVDLKDFVSERLMLELMAAQKRMTAAEEALAEAERRVRVGAAREQARLDAELELARARGSLGTLAERRTLRKEFHEKGTSGEELVRRMQQAQLRHEGYIAQQALTIARQRLELIRRQRAAGAVGELELLKAQVEVREREVELATIARQLREISRS